MWLNNYSLAGILHERIVLCYIRTYVIFPVYTKSDFFAVSKTTAKKCEIKRSEYANGLFPS